MGYHGESGYVVCTPGTLWARAGWAQRRPDGSRRPVLVLAGQTQHARSPAAVHRHGSHDTRRRRAWRLSSANLVHGAGHWRNSRCWQRPAAPRSSLLVDRCAWCTIQKCASPRVKYQDGVGAVRLPARTVGTRTRLQRCERAQSRSINQTCHRGVSGIDIHRYTEGIKYTQRRKRIELMNFL